MNPTGEAALFDAFLEPELPLPTRKHDSLFDDYLEEIL